MSGLERRSGNGALNDEVDPVPRARELTKARVRELRVLVARYIRDHLPPKAPAADAIPEPPRLTGSYARLLPFLQLIPWALSALFIFSFFWDFPTTRLVLFDLELPLAGFLRITSVSGLIGFLTNWLAITMLFNPRERRPIFGQGLIPAQRERVIYRLARAVSEELINEEIIKQKIEESRIIPRYRELALSVTRGVVEDPAFRTELKALTASYMDEVLASPHVRERITAFLVEKVEQHVGKGVGGIALRAYRFLNEADFQRRIELAVRELPNSVDAALDGIDHYLDRVPEKIEARSEEIEAWATRAILGFVENLNVYDMIISNMRQYDERQLERLLKNTANEQLNYIKYLGGLLGVVGGLVIWRPILALAALGAVGGLLIVLDVSLYAARARTGRSSPGSAPEQP